MVSQNNTVEAFVTELQALWSAEKMLTEAMPAMIEKATNLGLKKNLAMHFAETDQHKVAIEAICKQLDYSPEGEENAEMLSILTEGNKAISTAAAGEELDAAIITGAIKVEHYEIKHYQAIGDMAEALGYQGVAKRLRLTYEEERQAHIKLHFLEKNYIDKSAELGVVEKSKSL